MTAHAFPADRTLEALRVQRGAYAASGGEAAVSYDKLRDKLAVRQATPFRDRRRRDLAWQGSTTKNSTRRTSKDDGSLPRHRRSVVGGQAKGKQGVRFGQFAGIVSLARRQSQNCGPESRCADSHRPRPNHFVLFGDLNELGHQPAPYERTIVLTICGSSERKKKSPWLKLGAFRVRSMRGMGMHRLDRTL
jgi:hypothetical protein